MQNLNEILTGLKRFPNASKLILRGLWKTSADSLQLASPDVDPSGLFAVSAAIRAFLKSAASNTKLESIVLGEIEAEHYKELRCVRQRTISGEDEWSRELMHCYPE